MEINKHVFDIKFTLPPNEERKYSTNKFATVLASDLIAAVTSLKAKYPEATLYSVNHRGTHEVIYGN